MAPGLGRLVTVSMGVSAECSPDGCCMHQRGNIHFGGEVPFEWACLGSVPPTVVLRTTGGTSMVVFEKMTAGMLLE